MKHLLTMILFGALSMAAHSADVVKSCQLGSDPRHTIEVTREEEIADSYIYKFRYAGMSHYFYDSAEASRGLSVQLYCLGRKRHALVVYGEFTSNFIQGFSVVQNVHTGQIERLDFAERNPPKWLYMGKFETLLIVPTEGLGEYGGKKYVVYLRGRKKGAKVEIFGADTLPPPALFDIAEIGAYGGGD